MILCKTAILNKKIGYQDQLSLNAGQKYEHSAILSTFIKLPLIVIKIFVLSIFEWPFYTGFTECLSGPMIIFMLYNGMCLFLQVKAITVEEGASSSVTITLRTYRK